MNYVICDKCRTHKIQIGFCRNCDDYTADIMASGEIELEAIVAAGPPVTHAKKPKPVAKESRPTELELGAKIDQAIEARLKGAIEARLGTAIDEDKITAIARREIDAHVARIRETEPAADLAPVHAAFRFSGPVFIEARESSGENAGKSPREFTVDAYMGGELQVAGYELPIVIDLDGMTLCKSVVANLYHDKTRLVGHITEADTSDGALNMTGLVSVPGPDADKFLQAHDNGFPWQASIENKPSKVQEVADGQTVTVNGQTFEGPIYVARKSKLYGVAFLPRGADENTSVSVAATAEPALAG